MLSLISRALRATAAELHLRYGTPAPWPAALQLLRQGVGMLDAELRLSVPAPGLARTLAQGCLRLADRLDPVRSAPRGWSQEARPKRL